VKGSREAGKEDGRKSKQPQAAWNFIRGNGALSEKKSPAHESQIEFWGDSNRLLRSEMIRIIDLRSTS